MKRVFSIIIILGLGSTVSAQDYYTGRDRITADGITFLASVYQGVILSLANITNTRENAPEVYKDGSPIEPEFEEYAVANTIPGCVEKAFTETFTREEYELLRRCRSRSYNRLCHFTSGCYGRSFVYNRLCSLHVEYSSGEICLAGKESQAICEMGR